MNSNAIVKLIEHDAGSMATFSLAKVSFIFAHSFILGLILSAMTFIMLSQISGGKLKNKKKMKLILGSSNILFLCMGMAALMILVDNNLARAFAIGACLGLVRFKVKLAQKSLSSNFLFGTIVGIACGLQMYNVGWLVTAFYVFIQLCLMAIMKFLSNGEGHALLEDNAD